MMRGEGRGKERDKGRRVAMNIWAQPHSLHYFFRSSQSDHLRVVP